VFGWSYGRRPWSQHTYRWYAYDPQSKMVVYCARPNDMLTGMEVLLDGEPFVYDPKKHGTWTYLYDPVKRQLHPPCFGRPFRNSWALALEGAPKGVYAAHGRMLYHGRVADGAIRWTLVDKNGPKPKRGYNYEWQPIVYDSKRDRLIHFMGKESVVEVHARSLASDGRWARVEAAGTTALGREAVYIAKHDTVLLFGRKTLFALDCATNRWLDTRAEMPKGQYGVDATFVYDPVHDVCVLLLPRSFSGPIQTYLFRYAPAAARARKDG
jgi:hypothetical protein